jgi:hypothetical protein
MGPGPELALKLRRAIVVSISCALGFRLTAKLTPRARQKAVAGMLHAVNGLCLALDIEIALVAKLENARGEIADARLQV